MSCQRVSILLWQYLLVKEEELFCWWDMSKFLLAALFANASRVDVMKFPIWNRAILRLQPQKRTICIFLTFLENKRFFARTLFTSDYLSTLKLSMDKNEGNRFLNSWCLINISWPLLFKPWGNISCPFANLGWKLAVFAQKSTTTTTTNIFIFP